MSACSISVELLIPKFPSDPEAVSCDKLTRESFRQAIMVLSHHVNAFHNVFVESLKVLFLYFTTLKSYKE